MEKCVKIVLLFFGVDWGRGESGARRVKSALFEKIACCQEGGRGAVTIISIPIIAQSDP